MSDEVKQLQDQLRALQASVADLEIRAAKARQLAATLEDDADETRGRVIEVKVQLAEAIAKRDQGGTP